MEFRLESADDLVEFVRREIAKDPNDVDLVLISTLLGYLEYFVITNAAENFPVVKSEDILPLRDKFRDFIQSQVTPEPGPSSAVTNRQTIIRVASAVWSRLNKSFHKDKLHCQTLYTFHLGGQLDCFGLAYAVVAGCQVLDCVDVHLSLSEDHAWVCFGVDSSETAEITWHGKQNEVYRGQPINNGLVPEKSWLYLDGHAMVCRSRQMEIAAAVAMINPKIDNKSDSALLSSIKLALLSMLDEENCLTYYPMATCILAALRENCPANGGVPNSDDLYTRAVACSRSYYQNYHVYPYTEYGRYLYRNGRYADALYQWQQASDVLRKYNYNREDEELYKDMSEIANDCVPELLKSAGHESPSFLNEGNLANLLQFYDGICQWEESSKTPVLHVHWARPLAQSLSYFPKTIRETVLKNAAECSSTPVITAKRFPAENLELYRKSLVSVVLDVYGKNGEPDDQQTENEDFVRICETTALQADLVPNPDNAVQASLRLQSRKMKALRTAFVKPTVRASDVELVLCAQTGALEDESETCVVERKRRKVAY